ncbi:unnamed protein product [Soboliphyme baturini]|uniref:Hexosyltransferase n=1 Tax=Soboliphyme baturini TaxID=241478 RepID=A0A183J8P7_9BILA|nr:unnamed protein product [Soboliphyme baturini]
MYYELREHCKIIPWDFFASDVHYCSGALFCPRHNVEMHYRRALSDVVQQIIDLVNKNSRQKGRALEFREILYGYHRVDPLHGAEYVLDLLLLYKRFKGRHLSVHVRRHAYIRQSFAAAEIVEVVSARMPLHFSPNVRLPAERLINVIIPLRGRLEALKRFLDNFEKTCLQRGEAVRLTIVQFPSQPVVDNSIKSLVESLKVKYRQRHVIQLILLKAQNFSRAFGLHQGSKLCSQDSLMFFTDIDVIFTHELLYRIRMNTIKGKQVFYPSVFSEYESVKSKASSSGVQHENAGGIGRAPEEGYFRHFGFGLVSLYRQDYEGVGGFNLSIKGWGMEDVDLFVKFMRNLTYTVFRAPEPDLVHIYHAAECLKQRLAANQKLMCIGSLSATYLSVYELTELIRQHKPFNEESALRE